jgi:hypothetical protein
MTRQGTHPRGSSSATLFRKRERGLFYFNPLSVEGERGWSSEA